VCLYLLKQAVSLVPTLVLVTLVTFVLMRFVPGDPIDVMYGLDRPDPAIRAEVEKKLGLDRPVWVQYGRWVTRALTGDLGYSYRAQMPVSHLIAQRLPATLLLASASLLLAVAIAVPLGILAATRRDTLADLGGMAAALVTISVPPFVSGILLVVLFGLGLGWFPTMGYPPPNAGPPAWLAHLALPMLTLAGTLLGVILRLTRSTVLEELGRDYVRTARAKGVAERLVVIGHVLKNALLPVITVIGLQLSYLVGGAVIVEIVFAWPGIGSLAVDAILGRDYPIVQGVVLLITCLVVAISLLVDVSYSVLDPRVRLEWKGGGKTLRGRRPALSG
jgi:peptide/nickel transport system permease protein